MVYESDFYTTRRYRPSPSVSTYTSSYLPSKQVRILPGLGKVHVVHTYDRIVPYVGHKRLTVVSTPPQIFRVRPSVLLKEFDRIQYKYRPAVSYSYVNNYLNSDSAVRIKYIGNSLTDYPYVYTPSYYHSVVTRPLRLYYDILGYPRWSRYWYRYWYDVPVKRYSDYYNSNIINYRCWPSYWYKHWSPSSTWYNNALSYLSLKYPPLSSYSWYYDNYPYGSNYWTNYDSTYYWTPYLSRYWRSAWNNYWYDSVFNDETSRIRAEAAGLMKRVHSPVVRTPLPLVPYNTRYSEPILTSRITSDDYIYKMLSASPYNSKVQFTTYYSEPTKRFLGPSHLAAITYSGGKPYGRRPNHVTLILGDPVKNDIQLLSYYINKFRNEKALMAKEAASGSLSPARPSRHFSKVSLIAEPEQEEKVDPADRSAIRLSKIALAQEDVEEKLKRQKETARLAEERALAEEAARKKAQALKEEAVRKAELARQEELAAQAAAERAAEIEKKAEEARQEELRKQAEIERRRQEEEENARLEEEKRLAELAKAEEERLQLIRLEEIARQAEEEKERELARQAEELAELARQEAELEEQARKEAEALAFAKQEEELAELQKQEAELQELAKQEKELAELAKQEAELAELAKHEADLAKQEAEIADLATHEAVLEELKFKQLAELDALEAEAKALEQSCDDEQPVYDQEESSPFAEEDSTPVIKPEEEHNAYDDVVVEEPADEVPTDAEENQEKKATEEEAEPEEEIED
ncbi:hypothetical protein RN001_001662 [Aquatica leii]|uniref:Uncharacterized protein n=1 Tax=Aquatica leii TaxID=1421715 RepID=A0AAN7SCU7_9COLE|nr:hypothetical protein RN001_001662 [Aquatica leii]